jgi:plasmid stabilization system protein ParE
VGGLRTTGIRLIADFTAYKRGLREAKKETRGLTDETARLGKASRQVMIRVQVFGLRKFIEDLDRAHDKIDERVAKVTKTSVDAIKNDAQRQVRAARFRPLPHLARSFTSELTQRNQRRVTAEAGASHELLQGKLDVFIEHGSPTSNPHPHWRPAGDRELPHWEEALEDACAKDFER